MTVIGVIVLATAAAVASAAEPIVCIWLALSYCAAPATVALSIADAVEGATAAIVYLVMLLCCCGR